MTTTPKLAPLPNPSPTKQLTCDVAATGMAVPPIERIRLFSSDQWEDFVLEWADSIHDQYSRVERCGGSGDMGRDVVATTNEDADVWDNFQCKHYKSALTPTNVWAEFGKLVYYTHEGEFTYPRRYTFIAPQGAGNSLSKLLKKPDALKSELKAKWAQYCQKQITSVREVPLVGELESYLDGLDFSIFDATPPLVLIQQHAATRWHIQRFGGGLPPRPAAPDPPPSVADSETIYVRALFDAYGSRLKTAIGSIGQLADQEELVGHFSDARKEFYSAESLRLFSRDTLPDGEFERLQEQIYSGIADDVRAEHSDGYVKVLAVTRIARALQITSHVLVPRLEPRDRGGICHQLANDERIRWIK